MKEYIYRCCASVVFVALAFLFASPVQAERLPVFVSIIPQAFFLERIGGDHVDVTVLVSPGMSPHTYEPTPRQMTALAEARLYFRIGSPFESRLLEKIEGTHSNVAIVDTRRGVPLLYFDEPHSHGHSHGDDDKHGQSAGTGRRHGQSNADPHIWLDPKRVMIQAGTIAEALVSADPAHADRYRENLASFEADLRRIDETLTEILAPLAGQVFYVFHPAFGYFADSYGLRQRAIEIDGKEPTPRQLVAVIEQARREGVRVIFVQPQFPTRQAEAMAREIGGAVIPLNPLAGDYLANLERIAEAIRSALMPETGE